MMSEAARQRRLERQKLYHRKRRAEINADPKRREAALAKSRADGRARYERRKNDPDFLEKKRLASLKRAREKPDEVKAIARRSFMKRTYGITDEEYAEAFLAQGGVCAICKRANGKRKLAVDHDHVTARFRGLLCDNCNQAIGKFQDSIEVLVKAIEYLRES